MYLTASLAGEALVATVDAPNYPSCGKPTKRLTQYLMNQGSCCIVQYHCVKRIEANDRGDELKKCRLSSFEGCWNTMGPSDGYG